MQELVDEYIASTRSDYISRGAAGVPVVSECAYPIAGNGFSERLIASLKLVPQLSELPSIVQMNSLVCCIM